MKKLVFILVLVTSLLSSSLAGFAADKDVEDGVVMVVYDGEYYEVAFTGFVIGEDKEGYYIMTSFASMEYADDEGIDLEDADFDIYIDEDESVRAEVVYGPDEFTEDDILDTYLILILKTKDKDIDLVSLELNTEDYDEDDVYVIGQPGGQAFYGDDDEYDTDKEKIHVTGDEYSFLDGIDHQEIEEYLDDRFIGGPVFDEDDLVVGLIGTDGADGYIEIEQIIDELDDEEIPYNQSGFNMLILYAVLGAILVIILITIILKVLKKSEKSTTMTGPVSQQSVMKKMNLVGISGEYAGSILPLANDAVILGRDPNACHLLFSKDIDIISRKHCEIYYDKNAQKYMLVDYSTRGTFLNGNKLNKNQPYPVVKGDSFYIAEPSQAFRFE